MQQTKGCREIQKINWEPASILDYCEYLHDEKPLWCTYSSQDRTPTGPWRMAFDLWNEILTRQYRLRNWPEVQEALKFFQKPQTADKRMAFYDRRGDAKNDKSSMCAQVLDDNLLEIGTLGSDVTVYRGGRFYDWQGPPLTDFSGGYLSTTWSPYTAAFFAKGLQDGPLDLSEHSILYQIHLASEVQVYAPSSDIEGEFLIVPGMKYNLVDRISVPNKAKLIILEVDPR